MTSHGLPRREKALDFGPGLFRERVVGLIYVPRIATPITSKANYFYTIH
jgi:hypothetical protein